MDIISLKFQFKKCLNELLVNQCYVTFWVLTIGRNIPEFSRQKTNGTEIFRKYRSKREVGKLCIICSFLSFSVSCPGELLAFQHGGFSGSMQFL